MTETPESKPNTNLTAPVGSVDLMAFAEDGTPHEIWPCDHCLPWHAEVVRSGAEILVREWHAIDCPLFQELIED
ncbi:MULTISPECIES: hypothetical protein [Streptomyces]|uniref:hypothetical protein n=1 Tax=Streptomyces TaxID=1883 RepID=UPI000619F33A|nr:MULTISPECIES: hypothetical protein [Streptomyces]MBJ6623572.1 hypothetical protein [Streptomyces sp. DHE17-7]RIH58661.1 hypothetical protein D3C59_33510 [Streptomyces sp. SHP22-7]GHC37232.1 hypothetical protein GCM10010308_64750 [Streptomyces vinaceusdrappus]